MYLGLIIEKGQNYARNAWHAGKLGAIRAINGLAPPEHVGSIQELAMRMAEEGTQKVLWYDDIKFGVYTTYEIILTGSTHRGRGIEFKARGEMPSGKRNEGIEAIVGDLASEARAILPEIKFVREFLPRS